MSMTDEKTVYVAILKKVLLFTSLRIDVPLLHSGSTLNWVIKKKKIIVEYITDKLKEGFELCLFLRTS